MYFCKIKTKYIYHMSEHNTLGKLGENVAVTYLEQHGYAIRHRNWRFHHLEVDIISVKDHEIVFVEVKTRKNNEYGEPYDAVDYKKMQRLVKAADTYIKLYQIDYNIRFDIISVVGENGNFTIEHIKEAFYPTTIQNL